MNKTIGNFFIIGDSLSDTGSLYGFSNQLLTSIQPMFKKLLGIDKMDHFDFLPPYYKHSFTNNLNFARNLSKLTGIQTVPAWNLNILNHVFSQEGNNYAFGGAKIVKEEGENIESVFFNNFCFAKQALALLEQHKLEPNDIIYINLGSNDLIFNKHIDDYADNLNDIIEDYSTNLMLLINKGAKNIIISNIFDLGKVPRFKDNAIKMSQITISFNSKLEKLINEIKTQLPEVQIVLHDLFSSGQKYLQEFSKMPNKKATNACVLDLRKMSLYGKITCSFIEEANLDNVSDYFFLDDIHPTSWVHEKFANEVYEIIKKILEDN